MLGTIACLAWPSDETESAQTDRLRVRLKVFFVWGERPAVESSFGPLILLQWASYGDFVEARLLSKTDMRAKQAAAMKNFAAQVPGHNRPGRARNVTFSNPRAAGLSFCCRSDVVC